MLKLSETSSQGAVSFELRGTDYSFFFLISIIKILLRLLLILGEWDWDRASFQIEVPDLILLITKGRRRRTRGPAQYSMSPVHIFLNNRLEKMVFCLVTETGPNQSCLTIDWNLIKSLIVITLTSSLYRLCHKLHFTEFIFSGNYTPPLKNIQN